MRELEGLNDLSPIQIVYLTDDELVERFGQGKEPIGSRKFALHYAQVQLAFHRSTSNPSIDTGADYNKEQATIWNYTLEQAAEGNWVPMVRKLQAEAQEFFSSNDPRNEQSAIAMINLAWSITASPEPRTFSPGD